MQCTENYLAGKIDPIDPRASPIFAERLAKLPPTVMLNAGFDPLRDEAAAFAMKLSLAGVEIRSLYFPDMIHGFLTMGGAIPAAQVAVTRIGKALQYFATPAKLDSATGAEAATTALAKRSGGVL
jgi:acetyl esterase